MNVDEALDLLKRGKSRGIGEWNRRRKLGEEIPSLREINLNATTIERANFSGVDLRKAKLNKARLTHAKFCGADLRGASFRGAILNDVDFTQANLEGANLREAALVETNFEGANLSGCRIYGISAWKLNLKGTNQTNLIISPRGEPVITVDNIEVAQFIYLLLHNEKLRDVINTITSKAVLILGRFVPERKIVLEAIRDELRHYDYLPILFDFELPSSRDITETVTLLARMARFIIADLTDPSSIPKELEAIVPTVAVPVQPIIEGSGQPYSMFKDYWKYDWVLELLRYGELEELRMLLKDRIIDPAETKVAELDQRRKRGLSSKI